MTDQLPGGNILDVTEVGARWREVLGELRRTGKRVVIAQDGTPIAALISAVDLRLFELWERGQRQAKAAFFEAVRELHALNQDADPVEVESFVTGIVEQVRQERYEREQRRSARGD